MLRKSSIVLMAVSLAVIPLTAQTSWMKTYGDEYHDEWGMIIEETADGGFVVFGSISSPAGGGDMWLLKTDVKGDTQWTKTYGGTLYDEANSVCQTNDGGYIITGYRDGPSEYYPGDMWLLKTDSHGDTTWTKTWGEGGMTDLGIYVSQTSDGGYIIGCFDDYSGATGDAIVVMKTDDKGDTLWTYRSVLLVYCIYKTSDNAYVAVSQTFDEDLLLIKLDEDGKLLWEKLYGDPRQDYLDNGRCVQGTTDGGYVVAGGYSSGGGDAWLLKFDSDGDTSWTRTYGENPESDGAFWVLQASEGGYIMTGRTETWASGGSDLFIMKTDSLGYVEVKEESSVAHQLDFEIASPIGSRIVLQYKDRPEGFHAQVFDASGRKVDEIDSQTQSGTLTWGSHHNSGVYFIVPTDGEVNAYKVILIK